MMLSFLEFVLFEFIDVDDIVLFIFFLLVYQDCLVILLSEGQQLLPFRSD